MTISIIGLLFAVAGLVAMLRSSMAALGVFALGAIFMAASAIAIGPANVTPGHFTLAFFIGAILLRRRGFENLFGSFARLEGAYVLLALTCWAIFSAFIMPRLFYHMVQLYPLSLSQTMFYVLEPLQPSSSNINQSIYFIGDLATFLAVGAIAMKSERIVLAAKIMLFVTIAHVSIAVVDSITYSIGVPDLLDFMRNADYAQAYTAAVSGMKRLTGSYPEASVFAATGTGFFAFALRCWRGGVYPKISGPVAIASFVTVMLAFSSTGYLAIGVYLVLVYSLNLLGMERGLTASGSTVARRFTFISFGPLAVFAAAMIVAIRPDLLNPVFDIFDSSLATKMSSESGLERTRWNMSALQNVLDTFGLGAGLGSVRSSSFLVAVPANLGIPGVILFGLFLYKLLLGPQTKLAPHTLAAQVQAAARSACFATLLAASVSSSSVDLGLLFFIFAGLACSPIIPPAPEEEAAPEGQPRQATLTQGVRI